MQYGTAAKIPGAPGSPCSVSRIDFGWPGRLMISACPRITATCRDRIAVGTNLRLSERICSPKPGMTLSAMASVASGVTSRRAGPVPPVVSTRWQRFSSTSSTSVDEMATIESTLVELVDERRFDGRHLVGDEARFVAPGGRGDRRMQPFLERRDAFVAVDAGRGAVADGDQADDQLFFHLASLHCRIKRNSSR